MKKLQKFALATGLAVATLASLNSCKSREQKEADAEKARQEQLAEEKQAEKERKMMESKVYEIARDSVLNARGYQDDVYDRLTSARTALYNLDDFSQHRVLRERVDTIVVQHSRQCATEILKLFGKYNLRMSERYTKGDSDQNVLANDALGQYYEYAANRTCAKYIEDATQKSEMHKACMPWLLFGNSEEDEQKNKSRWDYAIDWGKYEYGAARQAEIQNAVLKIFDKMNHNLDNALRAECKKFAAYYPILDISKSGMPAEYAKQFADYDPINFDEEHGFEFEYAPSELCVSRSVSVYDSKLDVDFFGEPNATYKLVKVAKGKWQVVRTSKNGKVAKTPVFSHNVDYSYNAYAYYGGDSNSFGFEPGANMGVHVYVTEPLWNKVGINDKYPDPDGKIAAKRDSLTAEISRLEKLDEEMGHIYCVADSIAKLKQQEYIQRNRQK